ncbi:Uncharacterised protein [Mycobacteroides abscessus subsp. abscessus]|nr:Uncharacterised protein [Mycobacteroides abscessus subsp. abscessus]
MGSAPPGFSSPGWNMNTTSPASASRWALRIRAAPTSPAVCRSCPQACMVPVAAANSSPDSSRTGSPSMSPRSRTAGRVVVSADAAAGRPCPRSTAVTEVRDRPVVISRGRTSSFSSTRCCVHGRWVPSSGWRCSSRRKARSSGPMVSAAGRKAGEGWVVSVVEVVSLAGVMCGMGVMVAGWCFGGRGAGERTWKYISFIWVQGLELPDWRP